MSEQTTQTPQTQQDADPFRLGWRYVWRRDEKGQMDRVQVPLTPEDVLHPQEDDFIVQNIAHHTDCFYLRKVLDDAINGREGVRLFYDLRIDWEVEGIKPHGPDLSLFADVPANLDVRTGTFHVKRHGARPLLVVEVTSPSTHENDRGIKVEEYHRVGVPFYVIVDERSGLDERQVIVIGYRWTPDGYVTVRLDGQRRLWLEPVRLWLTGEGDHAVCFDEQGQKLLGAKETTRSLKQTEARLEEQKGMTEDAIEKTAEERKARVEAEKAQAEAEKARKEAEEKAADEAKARAEADKARKAAEEKSADEAKARKDAEQKAADLASKFAQMEADLRRLRGEQPS
jgi:colicin import membrane protein